MFVKIPASPSKFGVNLYRNLQKAATLIHNCLRVMTSDTAQQQREDMGVSMQARWSDGGFNSA